MVNLIWTFKTIVSKVNQNQYTKHLHYISGWAEKSIIPLSPMFGNSFKQGRVVNINPSKSSVTLESGDEIPYGYLVIATGLVHQWPIKLVGVPKDDVFKMYNALVEKVCNIILSDFQFCPTESYKLSFLRNIVSAETAWRKIWTDPVNIFFVSKYTMQSIFEVNWISFSY